MFDRFILPDGRCHAIMCQVIVEGFDMILNGVGPFLVDVVGAVREGEAGRELYQPVPHRSCT